jgi:hypothetical protein
MEEDPMRHVLSGLALSVVLAAGFGRTAVADEISAKSVKIKDNADAAKQQAQYQSADAAIAVADGYADGASTGVSLHVFSPSTANDVCLRIPASDCTLKGADADTLACKSADRTDKIQIKPGKAKAKFKGDIGYELDALASQVPVVVVLRVGAAAYCSICGDGGSDDVAKDGSDGKQIAVKNCDAVVCPAEPSTCGPPLTRPADPVVLAGTFVPSLWGSAPDDVVAFRWNGGWQQIPVQVDELALVNFDDVYNGLGGGLWCGATCGGGLTRVDYTDAGAFTGPDPDATLDFDDEVVFMAADAGIEATALTEPPGTIAGSGMEIAITDPLGPGIGWVYLFEQDGSLDPSAGQQYVDYDFNLLSGNYLTTYDVIDGPNPEDTTVTTAAYSRHFSDRWIQDELEVFAGGASGVDILDRHKEQIFGCVRTENTFVQDEGAFVVNRGGPVRALRSYVGANSGPLTQRQHIFYRDREDNTTFLRVHDIPPVHDFIDLAPAASGMTFYDNNNPDGLSIDGVPDAFTAGTPEWQMVSGAQGSVTSVVLFTTDVPGFTATSIYEDDVTPSTSQCTGDAFAYGANGAVVEGTDGQLPNTDPQSSPFFYLTATRIIYYDAPGLSAADAEQRQAFALNPLITTNAPWP